MRAPAASSGDDAALRALMPVIYEELRAAARRHMRAERGEHTLQATSLVLLPRAWLNLDQIWTIALILTGGATAVL